MDFYQQFIHKARYSRWLPDEKRRERDWSETMGRYDDYFSIYVPTELANEFEEVIACAVELGVMPSMRAAWAAGDALRRDNVACYNCAYMPFDHPRAFDELMYILMCSTGDGFSVERENVSKLPEVAEEFFDTDTVIHVADSKIGWAKAFRELIYLLYSGQVPQWDLSRIRPEGARLKVFGGRASGPEPLNDLFKFTCHIFRNAAGRKLTSLECHDLGCKIASIVTVGGVRRAALLSLSNLSDNKMRNAKQGRWWEGHKHRELSNNSVGYRDKPEFPEFMREWLALYESLSGERGMFNRQAAVRKAAENGRRLTDGIEFGTNPCSEIILRPNQFCNLSEVVVRPGDTLNVLKEKVRFATILGTLQATQTNFRYLRKIWRKNTEEEALLGVSLTGIMDHGKLCEGPPNWLEPMKQVAIETNKRWAEKLGINQSTAITCVKPSGTVSQLVNCASGIHPRFSQHYIRRVRADNKDPLTAFMRDTGFACEIDVTKPQVSVLDFPIQSPRGAVFTKDLGAMEQLRIWKNFQDHWCEHKPSCTVYYTDDEFLQVGQWIWENFDNVSGLSFYPHSNQVHKQLPYEEIDETKYKELRDNQPVIDWADFDRYEDDDNTSGGQETACSGGGCDL